VRLDIRRIAAIKDGDVVTGNRTKVKVVKNKVAAPFQQAEFDIMYGEGISLEGDLLDLGVEKRLVQKSGAWYSYGDERIGQGRENAKQFLKDNTDARDRLEKELREALGLPDVSDAGEPAAAQPEPVEEESPARSRRVKA
jgi:recombination protein RecA